MDNLSEEVKKGMIEKAAQGTYPSIAPYGYINVRERWQKASLRWILRRLPYIKKMFELICNRQLFAANTEKKNDC